MNRQHESSALNRIDLNLFRVFEVVYRERNLTRAASLLHLSQSAVSHALARLREQLGDPLFVREGRGVVPTALAEQLAPVIQDSLNGLRRSLGSTQGFDPHRDRRTFCLNMPEQMEPLLLPRLLAHFRTVAPQVELRCSSLHWADVPREMAAGRVDLAVEITRPTDNELRHRLLFTDEFCVLAGPEFEGELTAERYLAAEHVAITSQRRGICAEDLALGHLGLTRNVRQHCRNYLSAALLVAQSGMLLTLSRGYAQLLNQGGNNRVLPLPLALPPITLSMYWLRQSESDAAGVWLREQVAELARRSHREQA
ncbi:LysR family transcriptional regulator [Pseudomonas sp. TTU2014-080ASC]|uniref:LysR family transcriptional regulator n=1 Tax=Pseudomonas sp. TTU2014-080ASC TaxID=1729724 RepID=UPI0007187738|nr:LysR family transcriptional regulator [Pseudomonas sp. TTU2014-080ASC]KRW57868.1 LysR family transcriptional regulator [Pseudomonas sp. TTU2014-080ASC]